MMWPCRRRSEAAAVLHPEDGSEAAGGAVHAGAAERGESEIHADKEALGVLQAYAAKHRAAGNGFGFWTGGPRRYCADIVRAVLTRMVGDPRQSGSTGESAAIDAAECARLMGFQAGFLIPVSDTQAYKQSETAWSFRWWRLWRGRCGLICAPNECAAICLEDGAGSASASF